MVWPFILGGVLWIALRRATIGRWGGLVCLVLMPGISFGQLPGGTSYPYNGGQGPAWQYGPAGSPRVIVEFHIPGTRYTSGHPTEFWDGGDVDGPLGIGYMKTASTGSAHPYASYGFAAYRMTPHHAFWTPSLLFNVPEFQHITHIRAPLPYDGWMNYAAVYGTVEGLNQLMGWVSVHDAYFPMPGWIPADNPGLLAGFSPQVPGISVPGATKFPIYADVEQPSGNFSWYQMDCAWSTIEGGEFPGDISQENIDVSLATLPVWDPVDREIDRTYRLCTGNIAPIDGTGGWYRLQLEGHTFYALLGPTGMGWAYDAAAFPLDKTGSTTAWGMAAGSESLSYNYGIFIRLQGQFVGVQPIANDDLVPLDEEPAIDPEEPFDQDVDGVVNGPSIGGIIKRSLTYMTGEQTDFEFFAQDGDNFVVKNPLFGDLNFNLFAHAGIGMNTTDNAAPEYVAYVFGVLMSELGAGGFWQAEPEVGSALYYINGGEYGFGPRFAHMVATYDQYVVQSTWLSGFSFIATALYFWWVLMRIVGHITRAMGWQQFDQFGPYGGGA